MSAALDKRRINGPDRVFRPIFKQDQQQLQEATQSIKSKGKGRQGDRSDHQVRPIYVQTSLIPQANGSAYIECGGLKIACAVYGPRQQPRSNRHYTNQAELNVECRYTPFAGEKRRKPGRDLESSHLSSLVHSALLPSIRLSLLPKASLDLYLTIFECDTSSQGIVPLALTVSSLALATAGIDLWALSVGCSLAIQEEDEQRDDSSMAIDSSSTSPRYLVDPTRDELTNARGIVSLCTMPALGSVTTLETSGSVSVAELDKAVELLTQSSAQIHLLVAQALQEAAQGVLQKAKTERS
ncbi:unnamed protein product [Sympodiomycopsis kandeliae]